MTFEIVVVTLLTFLCLKLIHTDSNIRKLRKDQEIRLHFTDEAVQYCANALVQIKTVYEIDKKMRKMTGREE